MQKNTLTIHIRLVVVLLWLTPSLSAVADDAKEAHDRGVSLFNENKYLEASKAFKEANRLRPTWKLFFNIGQCEAAARRYGLALEAFEAYLLGGGDNVPDERRDYVTTEIRRIRVLVGSLKIDTKETLEVVIDGEPRGTTPLDGAIRLAAGDREIVLLKNGEAVYERRIRLAGGMESVITPEQPLDAAEDEPEVAETPAPPVEIDDEKPEKTVLKPVGFGLLGGGLAVAVGGVITGSLALSNFNELKDACPEREQCTQDDKELKESTDRLAVVTNILLPIGGTLATAGLVLVILGNRKGSGKSDDARLRVTPLAGPGAAGLLLTGRF